MSSRGTDTGVYIDINANSLNALSTSRLPVYAALPPAGQQVAGSLVFITDPFAPNVPPTGFVWVFDGSIWQKLRYG